MTDKLKYTGIACWDDGSSRLYEKPFQSELEGIFKRSEAISMAIYRGQEFVEVVTKQKFTAQ